MASSSSPSQVICASFNQDNSLFSVGTRHGFRIFDARNGRLCYEKHLGGFNVVEMLFGTSLLAIVGTGEQPAMSPRRLCLFNTKTGVPKKDLNFKTSILAVRLSRKRLVVVLQSRTFVYDLNSTTILDEIETVPNTKGKNPTAVCLCAFAPNSEECYLALPASTSKGSALVYKASEPELICQIDAHQAPLAAMVFSSNGMYLATASEKGSLHMFFLDAARNGRRQGNTLLSSVIPGSVTDALDPANHHVIHNVVPGDIKSCLAVHSVENSQNSSKLPALKTVIYIITHNGYFREYVISTTKSNESSWSLEREFSLLEAGLSSQAE
ncbi:Autophagy-related protein 18b [Dichanthelium oligosanthes]|uniref:Autophagy-related protein 18b n=1 Tax=Dichanthelium oligosanthes TaxID=888268 RepID=A0A1E5W051_9POAL|nr:Autophagy-related protein 18b [Dichanthelium oligosanthes]